MKAQILGWFAMPLALVMVLAVPGARAQTESEKRDKAQAESEMKAEAIKNLQLQINSRGPLRAISFLQVLQSDKAARSLVISERVDIKEMSFEYGTSQGFNFPIDGRVSFFEINDRAAGDSPEAITSVVLEQGAHRVELTPSSPKTFVFAYTAKTNIIITRKSGGKTILTQATVLQLANSLALKKALNSQSKAGSTKADSQISKGTN